MSFLHEAEAVDDSDRKEEAEQLLRELIPSYDNIYYADLPENSVKVLKLTYGAGTRGNSYNYEKYLAGYVDSGLIYPSDSERFLHTFDKKNLSEKFSTGGASSFLTIFRIKINDVFKWVTFRISGVPGSNGSRIIALISVIEHEVHGEFVEMARQVLGYSAATSESSAFSSEDAEELIKEDFLWNTLMDVSDVRYFWKDRDRRFLGASNSFLEFYGFDSIHDILGKNDEEMGWHPDDTQYRSDELDVLEKGTVIRNSPGQIYARGAKVNILATKYPIYKNGQIVGLIGYFMDSDIVLTSGDEMDHALFVDIKTGLLNSRGLFMTLQSLDDNYRGNGTMYGAAMFEAAEYQRIFADHGREAAEELSTNIGNAIKRCFSGDAVVAKTQSSQKGAQV